MQKISLEEFKKLKAKTEKCQEIMEDPFEDQKEFERLRSEIAEAIEGHDLSDIDYKEYNGFVYFGFNFEGTKANLDFDLIDFSPISFSNNNEIPNWILKVKGCNVKNVNLENLYYDETSFDKEFKKAHSKYFIGEEVTDEEVRKRYYTRELTIRDLENWNLDDECYVQHLSNYRENSGYMYDDGFGGMEYEYKPSLRDLVNRIGLKNTLFIGSNFIDLLSEKDIYISIKSDSSKKDIIEKIASYIPSVFEDYLSNHSKEDIFYTIKGLRMSKGLIDILIYKSIYISDVINDPEAFKQYMEQIDYIILSLPIKESSPFEKIYDFLSKTTDKKGVLEFFIEYADIFKYVNKNRIGLHAVLNQKDFTSKEEIIPFLEEFIETQMISHKESVPTFYKEKYPELFLSADAPKELKDYFYVDSEGNANMSFELLKQHPEWMQFLQGKSLRESFPNEYRGLFDIFDTPTIIKMGIRYPSAISIMAKQHKEQVLEKWYKATGGKFLPHFVVMLNFPIDEIDNFLSNGKVWSQLMKIDRYNLNSDGKRAILKAAYSLGIFNGKANEVNKLTRVLFTGLPNKISENEFMQVLKCINDNPEQKELLQGVYKISEDNTYILSFDQERDKEKSKKVRELLEKAELPRVLTPKKAHSIFDSFAMKYNPNFAKFFYDNFETIVQDPEYIKWIPMIQRQFENIEKTYSGRKLDLESAINYVISVSYKDIDIGNEGVAEQAKIVGYSQEDFKEIQSLYNEGELRDFSSIPRIQGKVDGYTYEMLRCDDPLALTIGTLTDCCQEIHGAGQTSMEHSVVSPDGRVFCVRDEEGRIVAQSWFWRNQYTGCFDNIEIPDRIFKLCTHNGKSRKDLTKAVLEVYKQAAKDLMSEDEKVYKELLRNKTITQEQYDSLLLGKITIGLGYNDIADAIKEDKTLHRDNESVEVQKTDRLPDPYTDAKEQYTVIQRNNIVKSNQPNLYVHEDEIPVYNKDNMTSTVLWTIERMENKEDSYELDDDEDKNAISSSQRLINKVARAYYLEPDNTKIMATSRMALIYSQSNNKVRIGNLVFSPLKEGLTEEQRQRAVQHLKYQVKKAIKQIGIDNNSFYLDRLDDGQRKIVEDALNELRQEKTNDERGEI